MQKETLKKMNIPDKPGVYFFVKGKTKSEVLYIGKATSLKNRVRSYFSDDLIDTRGPRLVEMLLKAENVKWQETDSVLEALILEASLIRKYQPKYNSDGKDNKSFNYVVFTKPLKNKSASKTVSIFEKIPKVLLFREREIDFKECVVIDSNGHSQKFSSVFGPFTNSFQLKEAMKIIRRIFPYIDKTSSKKANYEFYRQVNLAPDIFNKEKIEEYKKNIGNIKLFLKEKRKVF